MLTRTIDLDPFDLTFAQKIFRGAKRGCIIFAIAALTLSALDLANIKSVEYAAAFIHANRAQIADLPNRIRSEMSNLSFASASASAPVMLKSELRIAADRAPVERLPTEPLRLASADPGSMPTASISPLPVSLPMPPPAPGLPPPSPAQRLHLEGKERAKAERCLANAIYFEARGELERGQMVVAQVVINRAFSGFYPNDICGVVYQNASRHLSCQFTFACDGKSKSINERGAWARANRIAKQTLDGQIYVPEVAKSTHYHAVYVHPNWVGEMKKMVRFGIHNFYRPRAWGNGSAEPAWGSGAMAEKKK